MRMPRDSESERPKPSSYHWFLAPATPPQTYPAGARGSAREAAAVRLSPRHGRGQELEVTDLGGYSDHNLVNLHQTATVLVLQETASRSAEESNGEGQALRKGASFHPLSYYGTLTIRILIMLMVVIRIVIILIHGGNYHK